MKSAIARLSAETVGFLAGRLRGVSDFKEANELLRLLSGIEGFFASQLEFTHCVTLFEPKLAVAENADRREYGDFQTPSQLTDAVCFLLAKEHAAPSVVIEPTFGKGSFVISALTHFPDLKRVCGVEIHEPYCWQTKFAIVELFAKDPNRPRPRISLYHDDVFRFHFNSLLGESVGRDAVLVLGNPPWVTNAELGSLNSTNLPRKTNLKALSGFDAITGKGNFDIGEYIILQMLDAFSQSEGELAMLAKSAVIRNLIHDLPRTKYGIGEAHALRIDAQAYFGASVDASLFTCRFRAKGNSSTCRIAPFDHPSRVEKEFGWVGGRFVSNATSYEQSRVYDGVSPFVWRQGIKHDCSRVMELRRQEGKCVNGFGQEVDLEPGPVYGLLKSSDLRSLLIASSDRQVIVTQRKIGEDTSHLALDNPKLHRYLSDNAVLLSGRKSSIYRGNPPFSIFGVGDYSFKPYKIAISGLYKRSSFTLVLPAEGRPLMLDDTCYFIGFERFPEAAIAWALLNSEPVQRLLSSLVFLDAKRPYTKDVLMRIALDKVATDASFPSILRWLGKYRDLPAEVTEHDWRTFLGDLARPSSSAGQCLQFETAACGTVH